MPLLADLQPALSGEGHSMNQLPWDIGLRV